MIPGLDLALCPRCSDAAGPMLRQIQAITGPVERDERAAQLAEAAAMFQTAVDKLVELGAFSQVGAAGFRATAEALRGQLV